jgi:putative oxidoreductase
MEKAVIIEILTYASIIGLLFLCYRKLAKPRTMEIYATLLIALFLYASLSKLFLFRIYLYDLGRTPLIGPYAPVVSVLLPATEIGICALIYFERTRTIGLYAYLTLMVAFTLYVAFIITVVKETPCTCGGLIRELNWRQHLRFNLFFVALSGVTVWLWRKVKKYEAGPGRRLSLG